MDRSARSCPVPYLSMEILGRKKILVDACSRPESWWFGGARVGRHEGSDYAAPLATSVCLRLAATLFDVQQDDVRIPETATTRWRPKACIHFQQTPSAASGFGEESRAMVRVREVTSGRDWGSSSDASCQKPSQQEQHSAADILPNHHRHDRCENLKPAVTTTMCMGEPNMRFPHT
ncbi:hypothetical protein IG631_21863 [Alternaria alternata]|nr:hypothetical protein IG631_21863 [Alternaria alternata]